MRSLLARALAGAGTGATTVGVVALVSVGPIEAACLFALGAAWTLLAFGLLPYRDAVRSSEPLLWWAAWFACGAPFVAVLFWLLARWT